MDTIWGCDTEVMDELSEQILERAQQLSDLFELLRSTSQAVPWRGPDADAHRARTGAVTAEGTDLCGILRERSQLLRDEAAVQTAVSQPDAAAGSDPFRLLRADLSDLFPRSPSEGGVQDLLPQPLRDIIPDFGRVREPLSPFPEVDPGLRHPLDPDNPPTLPDLPDPSLLGGPVMREIPESQGPLPEGEPYDLSQEALERGEEGRRLALSGHRITAGAQALPDAHAMAVDGLDGIESRLVAGGHGNLVPAVSLARIPLEASSLAIGENSTIGQATEGLDHMAANIVQTGDEVSGALGEGDLAAAARAAERGSFRHYGSIGEIMTAGPISQVPEVGGDIAGHAADAVESVSPQAAQPLRDMEQASHDIADRIEDVRESALDSETWYDARREVLPAPWDPRR